MCLKMWIRKVFFSEGSTPLPPQQKKDVLYCVSHRKQVFFFWYTYSSFLSPPLPSIHRLRVTLKAINECKTPSTMNSRTSVVLFVFFRLLAAAHFYEDQRVTTNRNLWPMGAHFCLWVMRSMTQWVRMVSFCEWGVYKIVVPSKRKVNYKILFSFLYDVFKFQYVKSLTSFENRRIIHCTVGCFAENVCQDSNSNY